MYQVIEQYQAPAGKWMVRVVISADETAFFSFRDAPTQEQVDTAAEKFVQARIDAQAQVQEPVI